MPKTSKSEGAPSSSVDGDLKIPTPVQKLQDELLMQSLPLNGTLETIQLSADGSKEPSEPSVMSLGPEQFLRLQGNLTRDLKVNIQKELNEESNLDGQLRTHIILVVDSSGSMSGNPFKQVQMALEEIISQTIDNESKVLDVIVYESVAKRVKFLPHNYKSTIGDLKAGGMTNFKAAFDEIEVAMKELQGEQLKETSILFMTDGNETKNSQSKMNEFYKKFAKFLRQQTHQVVVHTVGFSKGHDLQFLQRMCVSGTMEGLYRYCEPGDGTEALRDKLEELFDYVNVSGGLTVGVDVSLNNTDNKLVLLGTHSGSIEGSLDSHTNESGQTELLFTGDCWLYMADPSVSPELTIQLNIPFKLKRIKYNLVLPCHIANLDRIITADMCGRALWDMSILSRNIDLLTSRFTAAVAAKTDLTLLKGRLDALQKKLSEVEIFKPGLDKNTRLTLKDGIKEIHAKLGQLHSILAGYLRGETESVGFLARAHDLRFEAKFSKVRRQRMMDQRVARNFAKVKSDIQKAATACKEDLADLSPEAESFFKCFLSLDSVSELLVDPDQLDNALGLALAVARPEYALDDPTALRFLNVSGALVSRTSIMDALQYKIKVGGAESAHGGFAFQSPWTNSVAWATVGQAREPINAWLPLYISPAHWTRVKSLLRPSLAYLCTLDPLGYSVRQLDVFFTLLGCMMGQLSQEGAGTNQLQLVFALQRTCVACVAEFDLSAQILATLKQFLSSPEGRFRDSVPNLCTLIGYLASLPVPVVRDLLGHSEKATQHLWVALLAELLRRAASSQSMFDGSKNVTCSVLQALLHGQESKNTEDGNKAQQDSDEAANDSKMSNAISSEAVHHFGDLAYRMMSEGGKEDKLDVSTFEASAHVAPPAVQVKQSAKVDRAMELWAQDHCGVVMNKNRKDQIKEAKKTVRKWVEMVRDSVGLPADSVGKPHANGGAAAGAGDESNQKDGAVGGAEASGCENQTKEMQIRDAARAKAAAFNTANINSSVVAITAKLLSQLSSSCFPPLHYLPGCMAFLEFWLEVDHTWEEVSANGGLPPAHWMDKMKTSMAELRRKMQGFQAECNATCGGPGEEGDDQDRQGRRNAPREKEVEAHDEVVDDEDLLDYSDEEYDVDEVTQNWRRQQVSRRGRVTVPMILSGLHIQTQQLQLIRAMLCQAVSYPSNHQAREAAHSGELVDLARAGNVDVCLRDIEGSLEEKKEAARRKIQERCAWEIGNLHMLRADSIWAFIGYLLKTHKERGEGFAALLEFILTCPGVQGFPLLKEKVLVLLLGKFEGHVVFANGNAHLPDGKLSQKLAKALGEENWLDIERELVSNVQIHVYRESDIPNRHGHCNSNPYIPNRVRRVLGMPLIKEAEQPRTSLRHHKTLEKRNT